MRARTPLERVVLVRYYRELYEVVHAYYGKVHTTFEQDTALVAACTLVRVMRIYQLCKRRFL